MSSENAVNSYRDLIVWQKSMNLVSFTDELSDGLPDRERFGLCSQMRRSAISIPSNIAEGWGRHFGRDYVRHLEIARGSLFELATQSEICEMLEYPGEWIRFRAACDEIGRILNGLIASVENSMARTA